MYKEIQQELEKRGTKERAKVSQSFFKTGKGQYGEGDIFLGVTVPEQRKVAKIYSTASLKDLEKLLKSKVHEYRFTALLILILQYEEAEEKHKEFFFKFYLKNTSYVNNWDLVDLTAASIVGSYLLEKEKGILYKLAQSKNLWEKRIAIVATLAFIRKDKFEDTLKISERYLTEKHDLMHKATGWMLRELGKKDFKVEEEFVKKHAAIMPRTMLRYAIERFPKQKRKYYLSKKLFKE